MHATSTFEAAVCINHHAAGSLQVKIHQLLVHIRGRSWWDLKTKFRRARLRHIFSNDEEVSAGVIRISKEISAASLMLSSVKKQRKRQ